MLKALFIPPLVLFSYFYSFSQETLIDAVYSNLNGTNQIVTYSYDQNNMLDTVFFADATRIYSNDTMISIIDPWGVHRFEYTSGFVNEYLTKDSIEFLKSESIVNNNNQVLERRFYLMDGTLDYADNYVWNSSGNCIKKNDKEYSYNTSFVNPYLKEYKYWKIGTAGSINYVNEIINDDGITEYSFVGRLGRHPYHVYIKEPGSTQYQRTYSYYYHQKEIPTVREVYDFDIGDIYHSVAGWYDMNTGGDSYTYKNHIITDKYYSDNEDTLFYVEEIKAKKIKDGAIFIFYSYTDTIEHTNLDSLINTVGSKWTYADSMLYNGRIAHETNYETSDYYYEFKWVSGYGGVQYRRIGLSGGGESGSNANTFYVKKGDEEWGDPYEIVIPPPPIDTLTIGEAYNFNIGDILHYSFRNYNLAGYRNNKLINKYFSTNQDTVYYIWNLKEEGDSLLYGNPYVHYQIEYYDTSMHTNLDNNIRTVCMFINDPLYYSEYIYNNNDEYNGRNVFGISYYESYSDPTMYHRFRFKHSRSLGRVVFEDDDHGYIIKSDSLIYFNKSGEEWGTPHNILGIEEEQQVLKILSVEYYDFYGRKINKPKHGYYIEVQVTNKGIVSRKFFLGH